MPFGATGTIQTAYLQNLHNKLTLLTDQNWPIMTNLHYLSLTASNMTAKLTNYIKQTKLKTPHAKCLLVLQAPYKQLIYKIYTTNLHY